MDFRIPPGSSLIASGTQATKLNNWKIVKNLSTRLKVLRRFGVKCSIEITRIELQCTPETPGLSLETEELVKSSLCEKSATESRVGIKHKIIKARGVCNELALDSRAGPILTALLKAQENAPDVITTVVIATAVTVWILAHKVPKILFILCVVSSLIITGVNADDRNENVEPEDANTSETHDHAEVVIAVLLIFFTIGGAGVPRRMCNFWRPLQEVPVVAAEAPAAQVPGAQVPPVLRDFDIMEGLNRSQTPTRTATTAILPELPEDAILPDLLEDANLLEVLEDAILPEVLEDVMP